MIVIGTRGSELALTQSRWVASQLQSRGVETRLEIIKTQGDRVQDLALNKLEGKGFFTKEIEDALLAKRVDFAVHSLKDLPGEDTPGLTVAAIPVREDVRDCLIIRREAHDADAGLLPVKRGARVGTSAVRRKAQLTHLRPDLRPQDLRGNVPTRLRKLDEQPFDAIVLAQAGLTRLGLDLSAHVAVPLPPTQFVPAPGQGALALQCRAGDVRVVEALRALHHAADAECVAAERTLLLRLNGGCHMPLGAHAVRDAVGLRLHVFHGDAEDATRTRRLSVTGASAPAVAAAAFEELRRR